MLAAWCAAAAQAPQPPAAGRSPAFDRAPEVELTDVGGRAARIDYRSARVTLVNFWATWCVPCREEMPMIGKLSRKLGPRGFKAVGIAVESGEASDIREFLDKNKQMEITYPVLLGGDEVLDKFGQVEIVPTTYLFDDQGRLLKTWLGVTPDFEQKVEAEISRHLPAAP